MRILPIGCTATLLALVTTPLLGQPVSARVLIAAGTATDSRGIRSGAYSLAPTLSLAAHPDAAFSLGGRGTRFSTGEWALGGSAATALRLPLGAGLGLLVQGGGEASWTSYRVTYLLADGLSALEWRGPRLSLWAGVRGAAAETRYAAALNGGPAFLPGGADSLTRYQLGPAFGAALRLARLDAGALDLSYREEHGSPGGERGVDRSAALGLTLGAWALNGSLGRRQAPDENRFFGAVRLLLRLTPSLALTGAAESYPSNRLTGVAAGRAFTAGLSLGIGGPRAFRPFPRPGGIPAPRPGLTRLTIRAPDAATVEVAGDWNAWRAVPLRPSRNGVWYADLAIPPGGYRYAFRINGKSWEVPKGVAAVDDGFGGKSGWLTVGESTRTAAQSANRKEAP